MRTRPALHLLTLPRYDDPPSSAWTALWRRPTRDLLLIAAVISLFLGIWLTANWGGTTVTTWVDDMTEIGAATLAAAALFLAAWRHHGRARWAWLLIATGSVAWGLGQLVWNWMELGGRGLPFPGYPDIGFLAATPFLLAGVLLLPAVSGGARLRLPPLLDGMVAATALFYLAWVSFLGGAIMRDGGVGTDDIIGIVYPAADVVMATVAINLGVHALLNGRVRLIMLSAAFILIGVADSNFVCGATAGVGLGNGPDVGWTAGWLLVAIAGVHGVRFPVVRNIPPPPLTRLRAVLPFAPVVVAMPMATWHVAVDNRVDRVALIAMLAGAVLFVVRSLVTVLENVTLIRALGSHAEAMREQAEHDHLTGLPNRVLLRRRLDDLVVRHPAPAAVLFLDLDDFKAINDSLGHDVGDALLVAVARRLQAALRQEDMAARLGGDEFAVVLEGIPDATFAEGVADRLLRAVAQPISVGNRVLRTHGSIGVAAVTPGAGSDELLRRADVAMYAAKRSGKGRYAVYADAARTAVGAPA